jgi:O-antigen/teichoic acid export membrane protein
MPQLDKNLLLLILGRILQVFLSLLALRVITTVFSIGEVGNYYLLVSIGFFFSYILLSPVAVYFGRHLIEWDKKKNLLNMLIAFCLYVVGSSVVALIIAFIVYDILDYQDKFGLTEFLMLTILTVLISTVHRNVLSGINILGHRGIFVVSMLITLTVGLLSSISIITFYEPKAINWIFGVILSELITFYFILKYFISGYRLNLKEFLLNINRLDLRHVYSFCLPIFGTNILLWSQLYLYRIIVDDKYGADVLGVIAVSLAVTTAIFSAIENILIQYYYPIFLKEIHDSTKHARTRAWNRMAKKVIPIYFLTVFFMLAMSKSLIGILVDEKFHYAYVFTLVAVGLEFFRVMTNLLNYALQTEYKTKLAIMPYLTGVMFTLTSLIFIDFSQNYEAIVWVLVIGGACIYLYILKNVSNIITMQYNFNYKEIFILIAPYFLYAMVEKPDYSFTEDLLIVGLSSIYFLFAVFRISRAKGVYLK